MKKNDQIELKITDIGINGEGIGRACGYAFFVKDAVVGDEVRAVITKMNKGYGYARALEVLSPSPFRVDPPCPNASRCGGCQIMQMDYREQLKFKENKVRNNLIRLGGVADPVIRPIIGMEDEMPLHFRNKVQFPVGRDKEGHVITGFYAGRTHYIVEADSCPVSMEATDVLLPAIRDFLEAEDISPYDEADGSGLVRHILIRCATSGKVMVTLVINGDDLPGSGAQHFVQAVLDAWPDTAGICLNINKKNTNVILGDKTVCLSGTEYIEEKIGNLVFQVSPLSFFQVNPVQTEKLYGKALEYAGLTGSETVWDLYCGTGTISLFLAQRAGQVCGVEIIPAAVENARNNASVNGISNAKFICGASEDIFPETVRRGAAADVVVVDPPRKGCDRRLLEAIMEVAPERIVYISCDSATLARDIKILSGAYELIEATPVDMFPHTVHVEACCLLKHVGRRKVL